MPKSNLKFIAFILALIATILFILHAINFILVFKTEKGLWDFLPSFWLSALLLLYPCLLFLSYFFYMISKHVKDRFHWPVSILFILNAVLILIVLIVYYFI